MGTKVAVVTGSNKGIGLAIVRALCKDFQGDVFLTARNESLGQAAVHQLESEGLTPKFHKLDITDHASIEKFRDFLQSTYKGLDVLVNNAAIMIPDDSTTPLAEKIDLTFKTNYFATVDVCNMLFPLLRAHARVCNVSSGSGRRALDMLSHTFQERFLSGHMDLDELNNFINAYITAARENKVKEGGFCEDSYGLSKLCLNILTSIQQEEMDKNGVEDILINSCTPGYVATDMTSYKGHLTVEEGAVTPTYLALLPPDIKEPRGQFLRNMKVSEGFL